MKSSRTVSEEEGEGRGKLRKRFNQVTAGAARRPASLRSLLPARGPAPDTAGKGGGGEAAALGRAGCAQRRLTGRAGGRRRLPPRPGGEGEASPRGGPGPAPAPASAPPRPGPPAPRRPPAARCPPRAALRSPLGRLSLPCGTSPVHQELGAWQ